MQVSRALRCLQGTRHLRTLQLFRSLDDGTRSNVQQYHSHSQRCHYQLPKPAVNHLKCAQYSTDQGQDGETLQSSEDSGQNTFDIDALLDVGGAGRDERIASTRTKLAKFYQALQSTEGQETVLWEEEIRPWMYEAIELLFQSGAPTDMRRKCLAILLQCDETERLLSRFLKKIVVDARIMAIEDIIDIVHLLSVSKKQNEICRETRRDLVFVSVNKRWFEIGPKYILFFMYQLDELLNMKEICMKGKPDQRRNTSASSSSNQSEDSPLPEVNIAAVENRLISLVDDLKSRDMARVVALMGKWRNRNQILLKALVHRLSLTDMTEFSLYHLSNILFTCSIMKIYDAEMLDNVSKEISSRNISSSAIVSSILSSFSHLRWYNPDAVSKCMSSLSQGEGVVGSRESLTILFSLANLYALPRSDDETAVIKSLADKLFSDPISSVQKVEVAWCLAVLNMLDGHMAQTVLDSSIIQELKDDDTFRGKIALQKLRGVSLAAKFELNGYDGPFMEENLLNANCEQERTPAQVALSVFLTNALKKFVDTKSYVQASQSLPGGIYADVVMCSDAMGDLKSLAKLEGSDDKMHRVSIQMIPFNGLVSSQELRIRTSGIHQMAARHLCHLGYVPVQIPSTDLRKSRSVLEQVNSIQSKIKRAVCGDDADNSNKDNTSTTTSATS